MFDRRRRMLGEIDVAACWGIEIGALHAPVVSPSECRMIFVDYAPPEELRRTLRHPGVDPASVVEVDVIWGERPLPDAIPEPVDFALASHVIEHFPDLIGWFLEIHSVLKPGGTLGLAIPDRRYTFDLYRNESTLAEMVEAHILAYRRPSLRQVFEACALSRTDRRDPGPLPCRRRDGLPAEVLGRVADVYRWVKEGVSVSPSYIDAHCWVFTPASFLESAEALAIMGCFPYVVADFFPTEAGAIEFHVRLQATDGGADATVESIRTARQKLPNDDPSAALRARVAELERRNEQLAADLDAMVRSRSWRITARLRAAALHLRARQVSRSATRLRRGRWRIAPGFRGDHPPTTAWRDAAEEAERWI
jgi:SAM-dependent methyltransferase